MKILIAGDYVPQQRVSKLVEQRRYEEIFRDIMPYTEASDYSIVNLEAPVIAGAPTPIVKTGPHLHCSRNAVEALKVAGFNCVTLANNHFRDQGEQGVNDTLQACSDFGVDYVGGGHNLEEASSTLYQNINGSTLAIVNFCENEWSIASHDHGGSSPMNPVRNYYQIREARQKADHVLVIVHGGIEQYHYPTPRMQETYRFFVDAGADAVINHHQHCYSGYEIYKEKPIFYGLGNFCFDRRKEDSSPWNQGFLVSLLMEANNIKYELIPYNQASKCPGISILDAKDHFFDTIQEHNRVIADSQQLLKCYQAYLDEKALNRMVALQTSTCSIIKHLQRKRIIPLLMSQTKKKSYYVRLSCESHRESLLGILKNQLGI